MLLRRSALEELGGYDPYAIAEDAELTLRITQKVISYQSSRNQLLGNKNEHLKFLLNNVHVGSKGIYTF